MRISALFCLLFALAAPAGTASDSSDLFTIPQEFHPDGGPAKATAFELEKLGDEAYLGTGGTGEDCRLASRLYSRALAVLEAEDLSKNKRYRKNPQTLAGAKRIQRHRLAVLHTKHGLALLRRSDSEDISKLRPLFAAEFKEAVDLEPRLAFAHWGLAYRTKCHASVEEKSAFKEKGDFWTIPAECDRSIEHINMAIQLDPDCSLFHAARAGMLSSRAMGPVWLDPDATHGERSKAEQEGIRVGKESCEKAEKLAFPGKQGWRPHFCDTNYYQPHTIFLYLTDSLQRKK